MSCKNTGEIETRFSSRHWVDKSMVDNTMHGMYGIRTWRMRLDVLPSNLQYKSARP
jgi:hypothetical protein